LDARHQTNESNLPSRAKRRITPSIKAHYNKVTH
jgi:hypothetical protein